MEEISRILLYWLLSMAVSLVCCFQACQKALLDNYRDEFQKFEFSLESADYVPEEDIDLGLMVSDQRIIDLDKV